MGVLDGLAKAVGQGVKAYKDATDDDEDVSDEDMQSALEAQGLGAEQGPPPTNPLMEASEAGLAEPTDEKPRGLFHDPYSVMDWGGWREKPSQHTYETLRQMAQKNTAVTAIIQVRTSQIGQHAKPQQDRYDKGFKIQLRDRRDQSRSMSNQEQMQGAQIERMLETTAFLLPNEKPSDRDSFRAFLKKATRDVLIYDQWCHPAGTQVLMANGTHKSIEDVEVGDQVFTHVGRVRRVTETFQRAYTGVMHRLRYRGQEIEATSGHPFLVERHPHLKNRDRCADKSYHREWVEASDIKEGQYLTCPDFTLPSEPFFCSAYPTGYPEGRPVLPSLARVMGLYAGDGHNHQGTAVWTFHEDEQDLVEAVRKVFPKARVIPYKNRCAVSVRVRGMGDWFSEMHGSSSGEKKVPLKILAAPWELKTAFLRGYIESDGHLKGASAVLSTTSLDLKAGLTLLCGNLGMFLSWSETANAKHGWSPCWQGRLSGEWFHRFAKVTDFPIHVPDRVRNPTAWAQAGSAGEASGYHYLRINEASQYEVEDLQVYNFEVEEDHSYIANGIVSHNCWEKIRDRRGMISRFVALPSETIRPAVADIEHMDAAEMRNRVSHVQVYEDTVIAEFSPDDIAWCVMNPRSDLRSNTFGFSAVEQLTTIITAWLFGFEYNTRFFTQGSAIKGLLNIKGAIPDRQLKAFRRLWYSMVSGVNNAWRTPILNSEDVQFLNMHSTNREMEFSNWMDFLQKITCAVFGMDPMEINFIYGNTGSKGGGLNQSRPRESELAESKDKGLVPLMEHIEDMINSHIIWEMNPDFEFKFVGLNAKEESKQREAWDQESKSYKMVDEVRAEQDLPPMPDGSGQIIRDSVWLQAKQGAEQQEEGGEEGGAFGGEGPMGELDGDDVEEDSDENEFDEDLGDNGNEDAGNAEPPQPPQPQPPSPTSESQAKKMAGNNDAEKALSNLNELIGVDPHEELRKSRTRRTKRDGKQIIDIALLGENNGR